MSGKVLNNLLLIFVSAVSLFFAFQLLSFHVFYQPYFVDEILDIESSFNFLKYGHYTFSFFREDNKYFAPGCSVGIVSGWPSALGWAIGGSMVYARFMSIAYCFLLFAVLCWLFVKYHLSSKFSFYVLFTSIAWLATFRIVPYAVDGVVMTLGEFSGAMVLGIGLVLMKPRPIWGSFFLGLCVWHTKFIYLPFAMLGVFCLGYDFNESFSKNIKQLTKYFLWFLLPLFVWLVIIWLRTGLTGLVSWLSIRLGFIKYGGSGLDGTPHVTGLFNRLNTLEWKDYNPGRKVRVLFLLGGASALLVLNVLYRFRRKLTDRNKDVFETGLFLLIILFTVWYFFWHRFMFIRHLEPALLACWAVMAMIFAKLLDKLTSMRRYVFSLACAAMLISGIVTKTPKELIFLGAQLPKEQFSRKCSIHNSWDWGPRDVFVCDRTLFLECIDQRDNKCGESVLAEKLPLFNFK